MDSHGQFQQCFSADALAKRRAAMLAGVMGPKNGLIRGDLLQ